MQAPYQYASAIQICTYHMAPAADFEATVPLVSLPFFDVVLIQPGPLLSPDGVFVLHYPVWKSRLEREWEREREVERQSEGAREGAREREHIMMHKNIDTLYLNIHV